jgi:hypothetical protein
VSLTAAYTSGSSTWSLNETRFETYTGNLRVGYRLTESLVGYMEYLYYLYDFAATTQLGRSIPRHLERQGARAGLAVNVPFVRSR